MRHYFSQTYLHHNCEAIENTDKIKKRFLQKLYFQLLHESVNNKTKGRLKPYFRFQTAFYRLLRIRPATINTDRSLQTLIGVQK